MFDIEIFCSPNRREVQAEVSHAVRGPSQTADPDANGVRDRVVGVSSWDTKAMTAPQAEMVVLGANDPTPVETISGDNATPLLLLCEHAGRAIPETLGDMGLPADVIDSHIGWDIGAAHLTRTLAERLGAPAILQRYSRLTIDCNRPPGTPASIPEASGGIPIPANRSLPPEAADARRRAIFDPLDEAIGKAFGTRHLRAAFSIHSFTPTMNGRPRPWHAGFLTRRDPATARTLMRALRTDAPELRLAINEPYRIRDDTDWFIPTHAEPRGIAHALIEIRNDRLSRPDDIDRWGSLLARAMTAVLEAPQ